MSKLVQSSVSPARRSLDKLGGIAAEELYGLHPRLLLARLLLAGLPPYVGSRLRVYALRAAGFRIGPGTVMWGLPRITGSGDLYAHLTVGAGCRFNIGCFLDLEDAITIGDQVALGHEVMILTSSHTIGGPEQRASAMPTRAPVTMGAGVWLGARATVLPGVTVGAGAVVAAGAVVTRDVPPNTMVGGIPARVLREF